MRGTEYRHTQFAGATLAVLVIAVGSTVLINETTARGDASLLLEVLLLACIGLFYCLRVEINDLVVEVRFGVGLIRKRIPLTDIVAARAVRNPWYTGWGIRRIRGGWLFTVSGMDAVEIQTRSGARFRIGTDEPEALRRAIESRIPSPA